MFVVVDGAERIEQLAGRHIGVADHDQERLGRAFFAEGRPVRIGSSTWGRPGSSSVYTQL